MKPITATFVVLSLCLAWCSTGQDFAQSLEPVKIKVRVVDEEGKPLEGAILKVTFSQLTGEKIYKTEIDKTGEAEFTDRSLADVLVEADKEAYYGSSHMISVMTQVRVRAPDQPLGRRDAWVWHDRETTVVLKRIKNPIPMIAICEAGFGLPEAEPKRGFDLMEMDWVAPHGKGKHVDAWVSMERTALDEKVGVYGSVNLTMEFPSNGDGILSLPSGKTHPQEKTIRTGTGFFGVHEAPAEGYQSVKSWKRGEFPITEMDYFRIRTKLDANGKVISAYYGKMRGGTDFMYSPQKKKMLFWRTVYLNPTPNDRNMECNGKTLRNFDPANPPDMIRKQRTEGNVQP